MAKCRLHICNLKQSLVIPVHVVPKKGGFTMIKNEKNELIPIRTVTGWRVCIDYRKFNTVPEMTIILYLSLTKCWIG